MSLEADTSTPKNPDIQLTAGMCPLMAPIWEALCSKGKTPTYSSTLKPPSFQHFSKGFGNQVP